MKLLELSLKHKGFPIEKARKHLQRLHGLSAEALADHRERQRNFILQYHLSNNAFYRNFSKAKVGTPWEELPIMKKKDLQIPLQQRLSFGFNKRNCYLNKTSGSGGHPFYFAKDRFSHALTWAKIEQLYSLHGIDLHRSRQARFYGIPLETFGYYKERLKDALSNRFRFPVFDLSDEKMEQFLEKFKRTAFDYIYGYTSSIVLFAKFLEEKNLLLKQVCPSLKHCIVTSEMLFESDQKLLERQFGVPVINEYGASEADIIAFSNTSGALALNQDSLYVELLNHNNQLAQPGEEAKIVVSALYNLAHPFIRYEIGDLCIAEDNENMVPTHLKRLIGRTNDVAILPNKKLVPGLSFYYVTKSIIEDAANIKEFVVEQHNPLHFEVHYVADVALSKKEAEKIQSAMDKYIGKNIELKLIQKKQLDRSARGKLKQFIRRF